MAVRNSLSGLYDSAYAVSDLEEAATTYIGKMTDKGIWQVQKYIPATGVFSYANRSVNPTVLDYASAWPARATLNYVPYQNMTGI